MRRMRIALFAASCLLSTFFAAPWGADRAAAGTLFTVELDLADPSESGNPNSFQTNFNIEAAGVAVDENVGVIYEDEPGKTGLRVELDVDLSDPMNPVTNTIKFVGEVGDIDHFLATPPSVVIDAGLATAELTPSGVGSFVRTSGAALPVGAGGAFDTGPTTTLTIAEGEIAVLITPIIGPALLDETFDLAANASSSGALTDGQLSTLSVVFDRNENGLDFYNVEVLTPLDDAESVFQIDVGGGETADLTLSITGDLLGRGAFSTPSIPEPATLGLAMLGSLAGGVRRR